MKSQLQALAVLLMYVVVAGAVYFGIEVLAHRQLGGEGILAGRPTVAGIWAIDLVVLGLVFAAVVREDVMAFINHWRTPESSPRPSVMHVTGHALLTMFILAITVGIVKGLETVLGLPPK